MLMTYCPTPQTQKQPDDFSFKCRLKQFSLLVYFLLSYISFLECLHFHKFYVEYVCIIDIFNFLNFHLMKALWSMKKLCF